jgi:hypothetical protein
MRVATIAAASILCVLAIILSLPSQRSASANVPTPPAAKTGAPPAEGSCVDCHSGNSGNQLFTIVALPGTSTEYIPGDTYNIVVGIGDPNQMRWGFEATVLKDSDNTMAGTLTTLIDPHVTTLSSGGRTYACHTTNGVTSPGDTNDGTFWGTDSGPVAWGFQWIAPPAGAGSVTFYAGGVAADGDGSDSGDNGYTATLTLTEGAATPVTSTTWGKIKKRYQ